MNDSGQNSSGAPGFGGPEQQPAGGPGGGTDLDARLVDPRNDPDHLQFNREFAAETDRLFQQAYGDGRPADVDTPPAPDMDGQGADFAAVPPDFAFTPDPRLAPYMDALARHEHLGTVQELAFEAGVDPQAFNSLMNAFLLAVKDGKL